MPSVRVRSSGRRLLPVAASITAYWITFWFLFERVGGDFLAVMMALAMIVGLLGAFTLRSGWACLLVPLALISPAAVFVAISEAGAGVSHAFWGAVFVLLHYNLFIGLPTAIGALMGWSMQQSSHHNAPPGRRQTRGTAS